MTGKNERVHVTLIGIPVRAEERPTPGTNLLVALLAGGKI
jgi:hypothetical protein